MSTTPTVVLVHQLGECVSRVIRNRRPPRGDGDMIRVPIEELVAQVANAQTPTRAVARVDRLGLGHVAGTPHSVSVVCLEAGCSIQRAHESRGKRSGARYRAIRNGSRRRARFGSLGANPLRTLPLGRTPGRRPRPRPPACRETALGISSEGITRSCDAEGKAGDGQSPLSSLRDLRRRA